MRHIIGIAGPINSGKTTLAALLTGIDPLHSVHLETSTVVVELADLFNSSLAGIYGPEKDRIEMANLAVQSLLPSLSTMINRSVTLEDVIVTPESSQQEPQWYEKLFRYFDDLAVQPALLNRPITALNKDEYRSLLQWIGGYFLFRLEQPLLWYNDLFRQIESLPAEIDVVAVTAPRQPAEADFIQQHGGQVIMLNRPGIAIDPQEVTERRVLEITPNATVANDASLIELRHCAATVRSDILEGKLAASYRASSFSA